jgi:hypothetical protein
MFSFGGRNRADGTDRRLMVEFEIWIMFDTPDAMWTLSRSMGRIDTPHPETNGSQQMSSRPMPTRRSLFGRGKNASTHIAATAPVYPTRHA